MQTQQQHLLLFVILLNYLFIKSYTFIYPPMPVNLEFYFSPGKSSGTKIISVTTRLMPKNYTQCAYHLLGEKMNDYALNIKSIRCLNFQKDSEGCTPTCNNLFPEHILSVEDHVLRMDEKYFDIRTILRRVATGYYGNGFNFTCIIFSGSSSGGNNNKPKDPYASSISPTSLFGIIFLSSCVVLVFGLCLGWFAVIYYRSCRQNRMKKRIRQALAKSTQQMLDKSPIITFDLNNKQDFTDDDPMCAICLESFKDKEKIRKLDVCSHYFHISCIDPWLLSHQSCPLCNRNILHNSIPSISSSIMGVINEQNNNYETTTISNHNTQTVQAQS